MSKLKVLEARKICPAIYDIKCRMDCDRGRDE